MASAEFEPVNGKQNEKYLFSNGGYAATARLNLQYYLWGQQTGYQLNPSIPVSKENLQIADVGAGTGIWLVNLSHEVPASTTLHGFDLKTDLLPCTEWLPSNVSFHELNVFEPVPEQFVGKYDIVHFRFFAPVVQNGDPSPVIECALKLLKPGGFLQWDERDLLSRVLGQDKTGAMQTVVDSIQDIREKRGAPKGAPFRWIPHLDEAFRASGLEVVDFKRHPAPKEMLGYNTDLIFLTLNEGSYGLDRMFGTEAGDALRKKASDAYVEYRLHGTVMEADLIVCVGRKPEV